MHYSFTKLNSLACSAMELAPTLAAPYGNLAGHVYQPAASDRYSDNFSFAEFEKFFWYIMLFRTTLVHAWKHTAGFHDGSTSHFFFREKEHFRYHQLIHIAPETIPIVDRVELPIAEISSSNMDCQV